MEKALQELVTEDGVYNFKTITTLVIILHMN